MGDKGDDEVVDAAELPVGDEVLGGFEVVDREEVEAPEVVVVPRGVPVGTVPCAVPSFVDPIVRPCVAIVRSRRPARLCLRVWRRRAAAELWACRREGLWRACPSALAGISRAQATTINRTRRLFKCFMTRLIGWSGSNFASSPAYQTLVRARPKSGSR